MEEQTNMQAFGGVYEHKQITLDEQLTACLQRLEEQVDQFENQIGKQIVTLTE